MRWNAAALDVGSRACPGPEASISKLFWGTWHRDLGELMVDLARRRRHSSPTPDGELTAAQQKLFLFTRSGHDLRRHATRSSATCSANVCSACPKSRKERHDASTPSAACRGTVCSTASGS